MVDQQAGRTTPAYVSPRFTLSSHHKDIDDHEDGLGLHSRGCLPHAEDNIVHMKVMEEGDVSTDHGQHGQA